MRNKSRHLISYVGIFVLPLVFLAVSCPDTKSPDTKSQGAKSISHRSFNVTATEIKLAWRASPSSDTAGYKIYYKIDSTARPYDGTGLIEGSSPIVAPLSKFKDPKNPEIMIHGLNKDKTYFFVITAYDEEGKESGFSEGIVVKSATGKLE